MSIVLNENEWAKDMIDTHSLGSHPFETLQRVARYHLDNGYSKKETRRMLDVFLLQCDPNTSLPKWSDTADFAVKRALKRPAVNIDGIEISAPELKTIEEISGKQTQRLAFTLLCLAKYQDAVNTHGGHWVNCRDTDIMRMANINTSIRRQSLMYHSLNSDGLIRFSCKVDNTGVQVLFIEPGEVALKVSDFRNLGYQYLKYRGEPFFECVSCGITVKEDNPLSGRTQKYCKVCAASIATRQRVNSVMRLRALNSNVSN